ncbi:MAG: ABC transporter substrate-binding protein [candidate division WOR-3 bacterium]
MKRSCALFLIICLLSFFCSKEKASSVTQRENLSEEDLMGKYGPKDLSKEKVDSIIESIKWTTNENPTVLGDKNAKEGGTLIIGETGYPATLRPVGENSSYVFNSLLQMLIYETLLDLDPITLEYKPVIADKWCITDDKKTYFYHINPEAKWEDGTPITAFDFVATWDLLTNEGIKEPFQNDLWNKFERPVALSKEILMVKPKFLEWRLFLNFSVNFPVFPERILSSISIEDYMKEFNDKMMMGSGPYAFEKAEMNQFVSLRKNKSWWGRNLKWNKGLFNFDRIKFIFYTEETVMDEKFKKGDIDVIYVRVARKWVSDFTPQKINAIKNNYIVKQKVYDNSPIGISGFHFNMREEPFNDIRVRKAFCYLLNREEMMEKLFFNEYEYLNSFYPNSIYENKNNPKVKYNPEEAIRLLEEAGYSGKSLNEEGYIVKDGKVFELELNDYDGDTRIETIFQEDLKKVGIKLNIKKVTWAKHMRSLHEFDFKITGIGFSGSLFPDPEFVYHSKYADKKNSNNIWGLKNKRVDEICEEYSREFDINKRVKLLKELDSILVSQYMMAMFWYSDNVRILYWNKFGTPEFVLDRFSGSSYWELSPIKYWWYDEDAHSRLKEAMKSNIPLPEKPKEVKYWLKYKGENFIKK